MSPGYWLLIRWCASSYTWLVMGVFAVVWLVVGVFAVVWLVVGVFAVVWLVVGVFAIVCLLRVGFRRARFTVTGDLGAEI